MMSAGVAVRDQHRIAAIRCQRAVRLISDLDFRHHGAVRQREVANCEELVLHPALIGGRRRKTEKRQQKSRNDRWSHLLLLGYADCTMSSARNRHRSGAAIFPFSGFLPADGIRLPVWVQAVWKHREIAVLADSARGEAALESRSLGLWGLGDASVHRWRRSDAADAATE